MPYPNTIGGGLMGYPSTVDTGAVAPFTLETADISVLTNAAVTAGAAYFTSVLLNAPVVVTQMRCDISGTPTGNVDMGIYDATGTNGAPNNLLGHTGAIAAATGVYTQNLTATLMLSPGRYWLALVDTVADLIGTRASLAGGIGAYYRTSATNLTVLPSVIGALIDSGTRVGIIALLQGSFS